MSLAAIQRNQATEEGEGYSDLNAKEQLSAVKPDRTDDSSLLEAEATTVPWARSQYRAIYCSTSDGFAHSAPGIKDISRWALNASSKLVSFQAQRMVRMTLHHYAGGGRRACLREEDSCCYRNHQQQAEEGIPPLCIISFSLVLKSLCCQP